MTNVEKLQELGILEDLRERLGAEDGADTSQDAKINKMTANHIVKEWCEWQIGDKRWWVCMKYYYDELSKCEQDEGRTQLD